MKERESEMTGAELTALRTACGWSQTDLAGLLNRRRSSVFHWEGERAPVPAEVAVAIRKAARRIQHARASFEAVRTAEAATLPKFVPSGWARPRKS